MGPSPPPPRDNTLVLKVMNSYSDAWDVSTHSLASTTPGRINWMRICLCFQVGKGAGDVAQQSTVLAAPVEDPSLATFTFL